MPVVLHHLGDKGFGGGLPALSADLANPGSRTGRSHSLIHAQQLKIQFDLADRTRRTIHNNGKLLTYLIKKAAKKVIF